MKNNIAYRNNQNSIELLDGKSFISGQKRPCVIRYFLKYDNEEEYYRALCILFLPFRDEMRDIHSKDVKQLYIKHEKDIEENQQSYERHRTMSELIE